MVRRYRRKCTDERYRELSRLRPNATETRTRRVVLVQRMSVPVRRRSGRGRDVQQLGSGVAAINPDRERRSPIRPNDPRVRRADKPRLTGQNGAILARLICGPATNAELAEISLKYTSRISDLRAAGYTVSCEHGPNGLNTYRLED